MRICGVAVLYNPNIDVIENINTYLPILEKLYVCDNSDVINQQVLDELRAYNKVSILPMNGNQGIAKALKCGLNEALLGNYDFCLTMDQDSKFPLNQFDVISTYLKMDDIMEYGIIGLNYNSESKVEKLQVVECWLTSGNFINLKNYQRIKGFNEELFIDYVDIELNEQFHTIGKKIAYIENVSLKHTIGNPKVIHFLGLKITCMNHSPIRYYYRYRNALYLYKKNKSFYRKKYKHDLFIDVPKIMLFEAKKIAKLKMIKKGRRDAKRGILGKYKEEK